MTKDGNWYRSGSSWRRFVFVLILCPIITFRNNWQVFRKEVEEKKKLEEKIEFVENNSDWGKTRVNQMMEQIDEYKNCVESLTQRLKTIDGFKGLIDF